MKRHELIKLQELVNLTNSTLGDLYTSVESEIKEIRSLFNLLEQSKAGISDGNKQLEQKVQDYEKRIGDQKDQLREINQQLMNESVRANILEMENGTLNTQVISLESRLKDIKLKAKEQQKQSLEASIAAQSEEVNERHEKMQKELETLKTDIEQKSALINRLLSEIKCHETILEKVFQGTKHSELLAALRRSDSNRLDLESYFTGKNEEERTFYERAISELEGSGLITKEGNIISEKAE
ncbi:MAG: hypothetical protein ACFFD4_23130 [Candidatus Odinarchaeota archaeon]